MRRWLSLLLVSAVSLLVLAQPIHADDAEIAPAPQWTRSIVCPVLYTHEVRSRVVMRRMLTSLINAGYRPTSLAIVDAAMQGIADAPPGCIVLTFDDALFSQYVNALPVLSELKIPAVFFAMPNYADGVHRYMSSTQLRVLAQLGFEVEAHTCSHGNLPLIARRSLDALFVELQDCKQMLEGITDKPIDYVAYPSGSYDLTVLDAAASVGYRAAFTTRPSAFLTASSPYTLPRIRYDPAEAPANVLRRVHAAGG